MSADANWTLDSLAALPSSELDALYRQSSAPASLRELDGPAEGRLLGVVGTFGSGALGLALRRIAAVKAFPWEGKEFSAQDDQTGAGVNRVKFLGKQCPFFTTIESSVLDNAPCIRLNYDRSENPFFLRGIRDELRRVGPGLFFGPMVLKRKSGPVVALWFAVALRET